MQLQISQKTVSIIIPVYKTEQYLQECMDSVFRQDYPYVEVILVDDGSPDRCPELCDRYAEQFEHVHAVHQSNRGLGLSRNAGMEAASGEYFFFLDSDDCLDGEKAISTLVRRAEEKKADIVVGSFRRFHKGTVSHVNFHHLQEGDDTRTVDFRFKGFYMYGHLAYNWGKLYRRSFLEKYDLKCRAYPFTQDKAHNMSCYAYRPVYAFVEESVYRYRVNEESVSFRYKDNFMPVWVSIASDFQDFLRERKIRNRYGDLTALHIFFGSFFLAKQELQFQKHGILETVKMLEKYGQIPFVNQAMTELAKGKYVREIHVLSWKILIRTAAILFSLHLYWPYAWGIALLRRLQIDTRITRARYRKWKRSSI